MIEFSIEKFTEGLNEEQKTAVKNPINSCTKIVAGAGTGKTKIISKRFVKLVFDLIKTGIENAPERILVITFTDKAAAEMKERIVKELEKKGLEADDLWISTFHSFCSRILKKHSIEAGLSPAFKMGEEQELEKIYTNIVKRIKYNEYKTIDYINELTTNLDIEADILSIQNLKCLNKIDNLNTIFEEIYKIIKKIKSLGLEPKEFLEKALKSTKEYSLTLEKIPFGFKTKDEYIDSWKEHLSPYADDFCKFVDIKTDAKGKNTDKGAFAEMTKSQNALILTKNGKVKAEAWGYATGFPENIEKIAPYEIFLTKVIALIYAIYCKELEKADLIDFDDLINKTIYILKHNELIRSYYSKYFKHLIIDEFQDTNGSQLELIKLLLSSDDADITFVGDRKQSIYGFRFAQMENLEVLQKFIEQKYKKKYEEIRLKTNYRSTNYVLDAVNYVTEEHLCLDEGLDAHKKIESENKYVKYTEFIGTENADEQKIEEAKYIANEILRRKEEDKSKFKDFAILVKSHSQAELVEKYLTKSNIPSIKKVNTGFFKNPVVKNAIALLRYLSDTTDEIALTRILKIKLSEAQIYKLKISLDKKILETTEFEELKRMNLCEKLRFFEDNFKTLDIDEQTKTYISQIQKTIELLKQQRKNFSLTQSYYKLINDIMPYKPSSKAENSLAERNLRVFEKIMEDYIDSGAYVNTKKFLEYIEKIKDDRNFEFPSITSSSVDAVEILTIHASKGLEFPYVFIPSLSSSISKSDTNINFDFQYGEKPGFGILIRKFEGKLTAKSMVYNEIWRKPREKNEILRLFYVAVSRAEKYLNVMTSNSSKIADYTKYFPKPIISEKVEIEND